MPLAIKAPNTQVPNTEAALYTCPASTSALVAARLVNTHTAVVTVQLLRKASAGTARYIEKDLALDPAAPYILKGFTLEAAGEFRASADVNNVVDVTLSIVEKS